MADDRFPALSIRQPFADFIMRGMKDIENRGQRTHFRGTILIHASKAKMDSADVEDLNAMYHKSKRIGKGERWEPVYGAIVGMVDIVDCVAESDNFWFSGPYGWVLENPVRFPTPLPFKGAVGIFYVPRAKLASTPAFQAPAGSSPGA